MEQKSKILQFGNATTRDPKLKQLEDYVSGVLTRAMASLDLVKPQPTPKLLVRWPRNDRGGSVDTPASPEKHSPEIQIDLFENKGVD